MSKEPKAFRLSEQAIKNLSDLVRKTGSNETALVELALANLNGGIRMEINSLKINRRSEKRITVERLAKPDLAGNRLWTVIAEFEPGAHVKTDAGWKDVFQCSDAEILQALK